MYLCVVSCDFHFCLFMCTPLFFILFFFLMIRRPPRSTLDRSSAASDVYKRQVQFFVAMVGCIVLSILVVTSPEIGGIDGLMTKVNDVAPGSFCLLYTSPSPRDRTRSRMPSSA